MSTYCEGSNCSKRDACKLHNPGEGTHEYIDWSTYGSGRCWNDSDGTTHCEVDHSCGDQGQFKNFVPIPPTKEEQLIEDINSIFREYFNRKLGPPNIEIIQMMQASNRFVINELWYDVVKTIKKYGVK